jgi:hypothetical protein
MSMYALISNTQETRLQGKASKAWYPVIMVKNRRFFPIIEQFLYGFIYYISDIL